MCPASWVTTFWMSVAAAVGSSVVVQKKSKPLKSMSASMISPVVAS